jgi:formylglycine-generating enzyme required for sulfatase activity
MAIFTVVGCDNGNTSQNSNQNTDITKIPRREMLSLTGGNIACSDIYLYDSTHKGVFVKDRSDVTVSTFQISKYETTYELWYMVKAWATANERGSGKYIFANVGREGGNGIDGAIPTTSKEKPVTCISWRDVIVWCNAYSEMTDKTPVYKYNSTVLRNATQEMDCDEAVMDFSATGYRLPLEVEWEYAARNGFQNSMSLNRWAGTNSEATLSNYAWYESNSGYTIHTVGGKLPNQNGLYDMSGNVREWCWDWYGSPTYAPITGPATGTNRVLRSGDSYNDESFIAIACRTSYTPDSNNSGIGFRVVLSN